MLPTKNLLSAEPLVQVYVARASALRIRAKGRQGGGVADAEHNARLVQAQWDDEVHAALLGSRMRRLRSGTGRTSCEPDADALAILFVRFLQHFANIHLNFDHSL